VGARRRETAIRDAMRGDCGYHTARNSDSRRHTRGLVGARRRETAIRDAIRGDLWVPHRTKFRFATPYEGSCGCQATRNGDSRRRARGIVGARGAETRFWGPTEGMCGRQPGRSSRRASEDRAVWMLNAALRPGAAWAGSVESLVNGRSILRISPRLSYLTRRVPRTTQAVRGAGAGAGAGRRARHTTGPPARATRLLRPRIVFLCPPIMRDRPVKVKPRFVPADEPHRPARPSGSAAQPFHRASQPAIPRRAPRRASARKSLASLGFHRVGPTGPTRAGPASAPEPSRRPLPVAPALAGIPGRQANPGLRAQNGTGPIK